MKRVQMLKVIPVDVDDSNSTILITKLFIYNTSFLWLPFNFIYPIFFSTCLTHVFWCGFRLFTKKYKCLYLLLLKSYSIWGSHVNFKYYTYGENEFSEVILILSIIVTFSCLWEILRFVILSSTGFNFNSSLLILSQNLIFLYILFNLKLTFLNCWYSY